MTNLIKPNDELIRKNKEALTKNITNLKQRLMNINKNKSNVLLCDVSGSMAAQCGSGLEALRAIDILRNVLENFPGANLWEFSTKVYKVKTILSEPNGGTNMGRAFAEMKAQGFKEIILLTDGQPDSPPDAFNNAVGLKINIIYIGPKPIPQFLIDLANITNGSFDDIELIKLGKGASNEIENKIKGLLNP